MHTLYERFSDLAETHRSARAPPGSGWMDADAREAAASVRRSSSPRPWRYCPGSAAFVGHRSSSPPYASQPAATPVLPTVVHADDCAAAIPLPHRGICWSDTWRHPGILWGSPPMRQRPRRR
jgi:hypothetical protein